MATFNSFRKSSRLRRGPKEDIQSQRIFDSFSLRRYRSCARFRTQVYVPFEQLFQKIASLEDLSPSLREWTKKSLNEGIFSQIVVLLRALSKLRLARISHGSFSSGFFFLNHESAKLARIDDVRLNSRAPEGLPGSAVTFAGTSDMWIICGDSLGCAKRG
jgi:hypothetical protein